MIQHLSETLQHTWTTINTMVNGSAVGKILVGASSMIVGYYAPIWYLLLICFATTIVDMIYGMKVARKLKLKIESGKNWSGTLRKIKDTFVILSLIHGIEWSVLDQSGVFLLTGGATAIITLTELWSIIENLNTLDPNGPWRALSKFLKRKGEDLTGVELNLEDEHTVDTDVVETSLEDSH